MADRDPRSSSNRETAPLLRDPEAEQNGHLHEHDSFTHRIAATLQEPLTPLTKVLLVLALAFLLVSSVFIGLFAGAQHNLSVERGRSDHGGEKPVPSTSTATSTVTVTSVSVSVSVSSTASTATSTAYSRTISTSVTTAFSTTTETKTQTQIQTTTVAIPGPGPTGKPDESACVSEECIVLSASILSSLDTSQNPCENFYQFATGNWLKTHPIPSDKGSLGNFELLAQDNKRVIQQILEAEVEWSGSYDDHILKKLRGMYSSCMNEHTLNNRGIKPLIEVVSTVQKLFRGDARTRSETDTSDYETQDRQSLTAALAYLHSRSIGALFSFDIDGDVGKDPNFMTLWFGQPEFGLPSKEYYEEDEKREFYKNVLERLLTTIYEEEAQDEDDYLIQGEEIVLAEDESDSLVQDQVLDPIQIVLEAGAETTFDGQGPSTWPPWPWPPWGPDEDPQTPQERAHRHAKEVVKFERNLARATLDLDVLYGDPYATYNPIKVAEFVKILPQFHFSTYLSTFTPRNYPRKVIVTDPEYAKSLSRLLNETPAEILEAYLVSRVALSLSTYLGQDTEPWKAVRSLEEELKGIKKGAVGDRAEFCISTLDATLGFASGRYFVNETFTGDSKEIGTEVITDIIKTFKASLSRIEWMDEESATAAASKADAIRVKVGYPVSPNTTDAASIAIYYGSVHIEEDKFFENVLSASASDEFKKWLKLGKQRNTGEWEMWPSMVNAYFNPPANEIVFPAGIMRPPFFHRKWPAYANYGSFGMVAAHELTHAFDSSGRLYNQEGKLKEWWTNSTSDGFNKRQKCISKQYSSYTIDDGKGGEIPVNGDLTSTENIGDTGLIQSYRAWKAQYNPEEDDFLLPGLNFTREQLFFISFARAWAMNIKPASAIARLRSDPHSPNRWRVDGTVTNIPEFGKAFNCPIGTKLNPQMKDRCLLW